MIISNVERDRKGDMVMSTRSRKKRRRMKPRQFTTRQMVNERMYEAAMNLDSERNPNDYVV
jgi:hypothetical protein